MSTPESSGGEPYEEPCHNVLPFAARRAEPAETSDFDELLLSTLLSEENVKFLLDQARERGEDFRIVLNAAVESYKPLYEVNSHGRPIYYLGEDRQMHRMDIDPNEPRAV
ncbi:MAG TPA: hypothetical protein VFH37_03655 [Candidatus Saccharimonadales bacterium]|nr:hypothetical protein [Candidatus Saccharimonadales bacterium]